MNDNQAMLERSMRSVFVGNIPFDLTEERLKEVFSEVGPVLSFKLVYDRENGKPKGYGFCEYKDVETANSAMRNLNGFEIGGRVLKVDNAANEKTRMELQIASGMATDSMSEPFVENAFEHIDPEKVPEAISKAVASLPPEQMFELMKQMKQCIQNNPSEARTMLLQNPQLAYGLLQSLVVMKIVDPEIALTMLSKPNSVPDMLSAEPRPVQAPPMRSEYGSQQQPSQMNQMNQMSPMQQMGGMQQMGPMGNNDVERPMDPRARMMGGPQQPMMGGPQQSMMGGPQQNMMGGPQQNMMGGPQQPMMGGQQQNMMGGPQQNMMGGPQQNMMGGPQQNMMGGGPQQNMMGGGPQQNMMGGPQQPMMGGPQQNMMGGPQPPLPPMAMGSGDVDLRTQMPMPVPAPVMPPLPHNAPVSDQLMRDPRQPPLPVAPPRDPRSLDPRSGVGSSAAPPLPRQPPPPKQQPGVAGMAGMSVAGMMGDGVSDQEKAALIMQVLQLTNEQIAMLPTEQRQSILMLKEQIAKSSQR